MVTSPSTTYCLNKWHSDLIVLDTVPPFRHVNILVNKYDTFIFGDEHGSTDHVDT